MWNWRSKNSRQRKAWNAPLEISVEHLEDRALLAGNVVASLTGTHLTVFGDTADNSIEITVINNEVQLRGLSNTTINGGTAVFVVAANTDTVTGNILISLGSGNDTSVFSRNVKLNGAVNVHGGDGNDSLNSNGATTNGHIAFWGGNGNDTFSLQDSTAHKSLYVYGDAGNDLISLNNLTINGPVMVKGSTGDDGVSLNNVTGPGSVKIKTGAGDDDVTIRNSNLSGTVKVTTRRDQDNVMLEGNTFGGRVAINLGRNNDSVDVRGTNTFNGRFSVMGGDSKANEGSPNTSGDQVSLSATSVFNAGSKLRKTEGSTVPTAARDKFDQATTGLLARVTAAHTAASSLSGTVSVTASSSRSANSVGGVVVTKDANVTISGVADPGATVTLDSDNDGAFDDGTVTADSVTGAYTTTVVATRRDLYTADTTTNDQLSGLQTIRVRSSRTGFGTGEASVQVDFVTGTLVQFTSNAGTYEVELFDTVSPNATNNFVSYANAGSYNNSIIHRSVASPAIIQGGGFTVNNGLFNTVPQNAAIENQFNAARGNIAGTIAMARPGGSNLNTATNQWFINTSSNTSSLDGQSFEAFGRVVGNGMTVVNAIRALTNTDLTAESGATALTDVPMRSAVVEFGRNLTGTVSTTANSTTITGVGTRFTTELQGTNSSSGIRSRIQIDGQTFIVSSITNDTTLVVTAAPTTAVTNVAARTDIADDNQLVRFSTIQRILV